MNTPKNKHNTQWLNAYHDGELRGRRLAQMEAHLTECAACQAELEEMQSLSSLFQQDPLPALSTTPEQFVAQVGLRLPRQTKKQGSSWRQKAFSLFPIGILAGAGFVQSIAVVSGLLVIAQYLGLGQGAVALLTPAAPTTSEALSNAISFGLNWSVPFSFSIGIPFSLLLPLMLGGAYLVWLILWWQNDSSQQKVKN